jgi:coenzyme PQQ precursor peptide PqqA
VRLLSIQRFAARYRFAKSPATAPPGLAETAKKLLRPFHPSSAHFEQSLPRVRSSLRGRLRLRERAHHLVKANGENMSWHAPKFIEVSCAMEITRYAPADGDEPILF